MERFGLSHLLEDQVEPLSSPVYWVLGALFAVVLLFAIYAYLKSERSAASNQARSAVAHRFAALVAILSGSGLAATIFAMLTVPFLSKRVWLILSLGGLVLALAQGTTTRFRRR